MSDSNSLIAVVGILGALIGALGAQAIAARLKREADRQSYSRKRRLEAYAAVAADVEWLQLQLDRRAKRAAVNEAAFGARFEGMELNRAKIDLVGSEQARIWAYRARLAISATSAAISGADEQGARRYRAKLHDARRAFMTACRSEIAIGEPGATGGAQHGSREFSDDTAGHVAWLAAPPSDDAVEAISIAGFELT